MTIVSLDKELNTPIAPSDFSTYGNVALSPISNNDSLARRDKIVTNNRNVVISQYKNEILNTILNDRYEDGTVSDAEHYMQEQYGGERKQYIKEALMSLYVDYLDNVHVLTGILMMVSCVPYETVAPEGQIMSMGLLSNRSFEVRDKSIQSFERWNSKKGISVLKSLKCDKKWMQRYVDKVIKYLERDGVD